MSRHYNVCLQYHMVICTKYRYKTINAKIADIVRQSLYQKADEMRIVISEFKIDVDHVHIMFFAPPDVTISNVAKNFKGFSARNVNRFLGVINKPFWSRGYYCVTVGYTAATLVRRYILEHKDFDKYNMQNGIDDDVRDN